MSCLRSHNGACLSFQKSILLLFQAESPRYTIDCKLGHFSCITPWQWMSNSGVPVPVSFASSLVRRSTLIGGDAGVHYNYARWLFEDIGRIKKAALLRALAAKLCSIYWFQIALRRGSVEETGSGEFTRRSPPSFASGHSLQRIVSRVPQQLRGFSPPFNQTLQALLQDTREADKRWLPRQWSWISWEGSELWTVLYIVIWCTRTKATIPWKTSCLFFIQKRQ